MTNVGLGNVPPPLEYGVLDSFQGLPAMTNVNNVNKGWNEFVLYGDTTRPNEHGVEPVYYNLYIGMTWDDGNGDVLEEPGAGKGLLMQNQVDDTVEGFYCLRDNNAFYNWLCHSTRITDINWHPEIPRMPVNR